MKLHYGIVTKETRLWAQLALGTNENLQTYTRERPDGGLDIWGWECINCSKQRPASQADIEKSENT